MSAAETPYAETEALLAVMNDDNERLAELLADMHPNELRDLARQAYKLEVAINTEERRRR